MNSIPGKIEPKLFDESIQGKYGFDRKAVLVGPQFGVDVSIIELQEGMAMAIASDPLSYIPSIGIQESAWLSVHLIANDIATTGHAPMYGQFVLNLPSTMSPQDFREYWEYIHKYCAEIGVSITGGHTGFYSGNQSTITGGGTMITVAPRLSILTSTSAGPGDVILVTKTCALSSTAILAMSFPETVITKAGMETYQRACESFYNTSSLRDGLVARANENHGVTAMHDVTEGGVLGAIYEMITAAGQGARIYNDQLPVNEIQQAISKIFDLDPRMIIGAGSMIITVKAQNAENVITRLTSENIPCVAVGEVCPRERGIKIIENEHERVLSYSNRDPYWKAFSMALKQGWK